MRAINFAEDMADRIRANAAARMDYATAYADSGTDNGCTDTAGNNAALCTEQQLAADDIYTWKQAITSASLGLPAGKARVEINNGTNPPTYTVTVAWTEREDEQSYTTSFQAL